MHPAVRDDRIWFQSNPSSVVRFRRAIAGEFQAVANHGGELVDVVWGVNPRTKIDEEHVHWFCRDPYGAQRIGGAGITANTTKKSKAAQ